MCLVRNQPQALQGVTKRLTCCVISWQTRQSEELRTAKVASEKRRVDGLVLREGYNSKVREARSQAPNKKGNRKAEKKGNVIIPSLIEKATERMDESALYIAVEFLYKLFWYVHVSVYTRARLCVYAHTCQCVRACVCVCKFDCGCACACAVDSEGVYLSISTWHVCTSTCLYSEWTNLRGNIVSKYMYTFFFFSLGVFINC